jgi:hypothetical protein
MQYLTDTLDTFSLQNLGQTIGSLGSQLKDISLGGLYVGFGAEPKPTLDIFREKWEEIYTCYKNDGVDFLLSS